MKRFLFLAILVLGCFAYANDALAVEVPVFPGAVGYGRFTYGGGGRHLATPNTTVFRVTTLSGGTGTGTLKDCLLASGPRVCVFDVSGTIDYGNSGSWDIENPYITIAGQTAPSPGITIRAGKGGNINTNHVVFQHLRIGGTGDSGSTGYDPIEASNGNEHIYYDHISVRWGTDENIAARGPDKMTIAWSITSEGLHNPGKIVAGGRTENHSAGMRFGDADRNLGITITRNLFALNNRRNPRIMGLGSATSDFEVINNIIYGYAQPDQGGKGGTQIGANVLADIIGNLYKAGPQGAQIKEVKFYTPTSSLSVYAQGNIGPNWGSSPNNSSDWSGVDGSTAYRSTSRVLQPTNVPIISANVLMSDVLPYVGARPRDRDSVDTRIINHVTNKTGRIIDHESEVGGYPNLANNTRSLTLPTNSNASSDLCNVGGTECYTRLEKWLYLCAQVVETGDGNCDNSELLVGITPPDTTPPAPPSALRVQ